MTSLPLSRSFLPLSMAVLHCVATLSGCLPGYSAPATGESRGGTAGGGGPEIPLSSADARKIGAKIWENECSGTVAGLTSWNAGEDFPSLGIGHFIWYVPGRPGPFEESFPQLIAYMKQRGVAMPEWLKTQRGSPWTSRSQFLAEQQNARMTELRNFLANTVEVQTEFIVLRLRQALPKMLAATPSAHDRARLQAYFRAVAESPQGVYALIDYVNFKGEGVKETEKYQGQGWGLRDVLLEMRGQPRGAAAAHEFSEAAKRVLQRRVRNAPAERNEGRWLAGWTNRCESYKRPL